MSHIGFKTHKQTIKLDQAVINLKPINLISDANILDEVLIKSKLLYTICKSSVDDHFLFLNSKTTPGTWVSFIDSKSVLKLELNTV